MNVVVKHPGKPAEVVAVKRSRKVLQDIVGGWIDTAFRFIDESRGINLTAYCDDEGLLKGLPINFARPSDGHPIVGTVVVVGEAWTKDGLDWCGLKPHEVKEALELLGAIGVES